MTSEEFARSSWQASSATPPLPEIEDLRASAKAFRRKIARRNLIEYIAGAFVVIAFGALALFGPFAPMRIGSAMVAAGTLVVLWQLHRRGSPLLPHEHGGQQSLLDYHRQELVRQRDAVASVFSWYLLPLIPGMVVVMATPLLMLPMDQWQLPPSDALFVMGCVVAVFVGVYVLNKVAAHRLTREISALDALRSE